MSFYRKYRPQVIDEIDNSHVRTQLTSLLSKERSELPHAYFFTGPKGTGKTTAARVIAKLFNCQKLTKSGPCGTCEQCEAITRGSSIDVIEMDAASNRGIDEIRQLRERIGLAPVSATYTIYIIDEVHMLTTEAFNALLKTLEEPPNHAVFVLATTDAHKVPATIKSRCMEIPFHRATPDELTHALGRVVKGEGLKAEAEAIAVLAAAADGSFRDAVKLLEQASLHSKEITGQSVAMIIPTLGHEKLGNFLVPLFAKDVTTSLDYVSALREGGFDMRAFIIFLLQALEQDLVSSVKGTKEKMHGPRAELELGIRLFTRAYEEMRYSPIPQLPIELAIIEFCLHDVGPSRAAAPPVVATVSATSATPGTSTPAREPLPPKDVPRQEPATRSLGLLTHEKLVEHWPDFIVAMKPYNHSVAGVLRSSRPKAVEGGIVTIEAFYKFHQEKLADIRTRQMLADVLKKLFGEKVSIEIVLGRK